MNTQEQQHRLHHKPFLLMWVVSFGVAWLGVFFGAFLIVDMFNRTEFLDPIFYWFERNSWLYGVMIGAGFGAFLALVQAWLIRWRYGFIPRFWRHSTVIGALIAGTLAGISMFSYYATNPMSRLTPISLWFISLTLVQSLALWPVVRRAWLFALAGLGAAGIAFVTGLWDMYGIGIVSSLFFGSFAQAVFSGALFLYLMRDYRLEAVPKRDEKSKGMQRRGLHPISFIGLWMLLHLFGWVALMSAYFLLILSSMAIPPIMTFLNALGQVNWVLGVLLGITVGSMTAIGQPWLMQQQGGYRPRTWMPISVLAWAIGGLGLWNFMQIYNGQGFWHGAMLVAWFGLPTLFQSFVLRKDLRGAWLYALSGIVSGIVAYLVYQEVANSSGQIYAVIFGAVVQAILTGVAFLTIIRQNQAETTPQEAVVEAEAA
jgi:hypothetical protein